MSKIENASRGTLTYHRCAACTHRHRLVDYFADANQRVEWLTPCMEEGCGCNVDRAEYEGQVPPLDEYVERGPRLSIGSGGYWMNPVHPIPEPRGADSYAERMLGLVRLVKIFKAGLR